MVRTISFTLLRRKGNRILKCNNNSVMFNETYRSAKHLQQSLQIAQEGTPEIPDRVRSKLEYYSHPDAGEPAQFSCAETVGQLADLEGRSNDLFVPLVTILNRYEAVHPGMFLVERFSEAGVRTEFNARGAAQVKFNNITESMLAAISQKQAVFNGGGIGDSCGTDHANRVSECLKQILVGPLPSLIEPGNEKPILVLIDMSYTAAQLFRFFSGIYCDFTPLLPLSKVDFFAFAVNHERAHSLTENVTASNGNSSGLQALGFEGDHATISARNYLESVADVFGVLKHIQMTGSTVLPEQLAAMRALSVFSHSFCRFDTAFTLKMGGDSRLRCTTEYYTVPAIDQAIKTGEQLQASGQLQRLSDGELMRLATTIASEFKESKDALLALSACCDSLTFNAIRRNPPELFPVHKDSISPFVVSKMLDIIASRGNFIPQGGASLERRLEDLSKGRPIARIPIDDDLNRIFNRYKAALSYVVENGIKPFSERGKKMILEDLLATISLPSNQTPNSSVAREINDQWAGRQKYTALSGIAYGSFNN